MDKMNPFVRKLYTDRRAGSERKGLNKYIHCNNKTGYINTVSKSFKVK